MPPMIKFGNLEFKSGLRGPKFVKRSGECRTLSNHKIEVIFDKYPWRGKTDIGCRLQMTTLTPKGPRSFFSQKPLKTAISTAFIKKTKTKNFFYNLTTGSCTLLV